MPEPETGQAVKPAGQDSRAQLADERWDIEAVDSSGDVLVAWRGVRLHDAGPLPRNAAWPPSLLSIYLERACRDLGLNAGLRVTVSCGQPDWPGPQFLATAVPRQALPADPPRRPANGNRRAAAKPNAPITTGTGPLAGFTLSATAPGVVACSWAAVELGHRHDAPPPVMAQAYARLRAELDEPGGALAARVRAISACLETDGRPADDPLLFERTTSEGWAAVTAGAARVACTVVEISGVACPVAIAILTGPAAAGSRAATTAARAAATGRPKAAPRAAGARAKPSSAVRR